MVEHDDEAAEAVLDRIDAALDAIDPVRASEDNLEPMQVLMEALTELGRLTERDPEVLARPALGERRQRQGARIAPLLRLFDYFQTRWEGRLWAGWESSWKALCIARSGAAFLLDLYRDTPVTEGENALLKEDFEDWDGYIRDQQDMFGGVPEPEIPDGIPVSHWWWR